MGACYQPTDLKYIKEGRRYIKISHTVHFTQYKVHHWNDIQNPILVIWLMSGMIVFDLYYMGNYDTPSNYFYTIQAYMLVPCSSIMAMPNLIGLKIRWYSTSNLLNIMEALLLEILAESWNNCQRYNHTLPRYTCIASMSTPLERKHKSGPSDIIHLLYSGTPKAYRAH